jgi:hypothetical protein
VDTDLILVIGLIVAVLTVPSIFSALADGRAPRKSAIMVLIAGGLIALAVTQKPGGYSIEDIPAAFLSVIDRYIRAI